MSFFYTVLTGILVFVIGRLLEKFFIEPWKKQREVIGEVLELLMFHANIYSKPVYIPNKLLKDERTKKQEETYAALRKISTQLVASTYSIFYYDFFADIFSMPKKTEIFKASELLNELSVNLYRKSDSEVQTAVDNKYRRIEITGILGITKFMEDSISDKLNRP